MIIILIRLLDDITEKCCRRYDKSRTSVKNSRLNGNLAYFSIRSTFDKTLTCGCSTYTIMDQSITNL